MISHMLYCTYLREVWQCHESACRWWEKISGLCWSWSMCRRWCRSRGRGYTCSDGRFFKWFLGSPMSVFSCWQLIRPGKSNFCENPSSETKRCRNQNQIINLWWNIYSQSISKILGAVLDPPNFRPLSPFLLYWEFVLFWMHMICWHIVTVTIWQSPQNYIFYIV